MAWGPEDGTSHLPYAPDETVQWVWFSQTMPCLPWGLLFYPDFSQIFSCWRCWMSSVCYKESCYERVCYLHQVSQLGVSIFTPLMSLHQVICHICRSCSSCANMYQLQWSSKGFHPTLKQCHDTWHNCVTLEDSGITQLTMADIWSVISNHSSKLVRERHCCVLQLCSIGLQQTSLSWTL